MTVATRRATGEVRVGIEPSEANRPQSDLEPVPAKASQDRVLMLALATLSTMGAAAVGVCALTLAGVVRLGVPIGAIEPYRPVLWSGAAIRGLLFLLHRHHRNRRCRGYADEVAEAFREATMGSLGLVLFTFFWRGGSRYHTFSYSRSVFVLDWLLAAIGLSAVLIGGKLVLSQVRRRGRNRRRLAIVGDSPAARHLVSTINDHPEMGYEVATHVRAPQRGRGSLLAELARLAPARRVDGLVLATDAVGRGDIARLVAVSQFRKLDVHAVPELFGLSPAKISLDTVGPFPLLSLLQDPIRGPRRVMKRACDITGAVLTLLVLSPVMVAAALAVRLSSPGPILFRQDRVGMDGRAFRMLKFRTMYHGADSASHRQFVVNLVRDVDRPKDRFRGLYKLSSDPRITRPGHILRRLSIDELPQLFNVLKGDMSLVGPRPALPYEADAYDDWHRRRLDLRPGMTGLWQVSGRSTLPYDEMVRLDVAYIETWSPLRDLVILARTIPAILRGESG
ncbi:MAG: sugar transferase [Actinomycetota bacterium]|nr:sugar transferase [Actinomycetota bacterium]